MKTKMKKLISSKSIPILTLALFAGVVLITGIAWAKTTEYSVNCEFTYGSTSMAKNWTDDEGVEHIRGIVYLLNSDPNSGNITINMAGVCNHNREMVVTGEGDFWGHEYAQVTWGDLTGTFQGMHGGIRTNFYDSSSIHVYECIDGDLIGEPGYTEDNNGFFPRRTSGAGRWIDVLYDYYYRDEKIRICPMGNNRAYTSPYPIPVLPTFLLGQGCTCGSLGAGFPLSGYNFY